MITDFKKFKKAVAAQFMKMQEHHLFRTAASREEMWKTYLNAFPAGTNPIYRERTEHDCSCCRHFIYAVGNTVAIIDGELVTIWDCQIGDPTYQVVADAMAATIKRQPIVDIFLHYDAVAGVDKNYDEHTTPVVTWQHFFVNIKRENVVKSAVVRNAALANHRSTYNVLLRSLDEITVEAIDTVLELIDQNALYRGEEHQRAVKEFRVIKSLHETHKKNADALVWQNVASGNPAVTRIRNTAIGTLLVDLSAGRDLEEAVKAFETIVAPTNYKRPTALVTQAMVDKAREVIESLGLTSALGRRYATLRDINVNDILFADRGARQVMTGTVFDDIKPTAAGKGKKLDKVEEVFIDKFIKDFLPRAETIEVMLENRHIGNLVSLIAPEDPTAGHLFKWDNNFSWSYNGELADSIKERVKKAGGNVSGDLCCRLAWFNYDDLDLHMHDPNAHIFYSDKKPYGCAGQLDVDMNAGGLRSKTPVENIFYASRRDMKEGVYRLNVHQYMKRETENTGFEVEIDFMGDIRSFAYAKALRQDEIVEVAVMKYSRKNGLEFLESLPSSAAVRTAWGLNTQTFHRVSVLMQSPNHWEGNDKTAGNRHYFFMLDGCRNDGRARGFFNEFLRADLNTNRKVFEIVGSKIKVEDNSDQLSGLGFSSTQRNSLLCRISGSFSRTIKVVF